MRLSSRITPYRWGYSVVGFGVLVCWEGVGDGRSGTLGHGAGGQPAMTPCGSAVVDEVSGEFSSTSLRSTIRRMGAPTHFRRWVGTGTSEGNGGGVCRGHEGP